MLYSSMFYFLHPRCFFFIKKLRTWNVFVEKIKTRLAPMNPIHPLSRKEVEKDGIDAISKVFSLSLFLLVSST